MDNVDERRLPAFPVWERGCPIIHVPDDIIGLQFP